jgi:hypothetical protein
MATPMGERADDLDARGTSILTAIATGLRCGIESSPSSWRPHAARGLTPTHHRSRVREGRNRSRPPRSWRGQTADDRTVQEVTDARNGKL